MKIGSWGALGFTVGAAIMIAAFYWLVTRRILVSTTRQTSKPFSAFKLGWRGTLGLARAAPLVALAAYGIKLFQILGKDFQNLLLGRHPMAWSIAGMGIDLIFALVWAVVALRIYFYILAPEATPEERHARTRLTVIYALAFWGVGIVMNILGIGLVVWVHGADHGVVIRIVGYLSYALTVVAAMTRPGLARGLKYPLRESLRILRTNIFGGAVTLILAALPLGLVFLVVAVIADFVRLKVYVALLLELPIAAVSALCYLAFEGTVAATYRRLM